ncbi:MAG: glycine betaine ABC transporter substrate-binding protein [Planctomycetota bacterium]
MSNAVRLSIIAAVVIAVGTALVLIQPPGATGDTLRAAFDAEFHSRPDGYKGLCEHYDFRFPTPPRQMDSGLMYQACAGGQVDVINAFTSDGRIAAFDLQVLEDDQRFFPPYYAAPLVNAAILEAHPELEAPLRKLGGAIDTAQMQTLNYQVDEQGRKARVVARDFLVEQGLLAADAQPRAADDAATIVVAGKQFTEQEILGEMMALMIECTTDLAVDRRLNLGGTMICFNATRSGDIDVYAEYTGTGLVSILEREVMSDPEAVYDLVSREFRERYGLAWFDPFGFNNSYTLTMRKEHAEKLGIATISDLAAHCREQNAAE